MLGISKSFSLNEKIAASFIVLFLPFYFLCTWATSTSIYDAGPSYGRHLIWLVVWVTIGFVAFCVSIGVVFFKPAFHTSHMRMNIGRFLPLIALVTGLLLNYEIDKIYSSHRQRVFAAHHQVNLAGPPPQSVIYTEGIPDGGNAIIRSPGNNPKKFSQSVMNNLTGQRITSCRKLDERDWFCHFD